jgi:hypothetical protein
MEVQTPLSVVIGAVILTVAVLGYYAYLVVQFFAAVL